MSFQAGEPPETWAPLLVDYVKKQQKMVAPGGSTEVTGRMRKLGLLPLKDGAPFVVRLGSSATVTPWDTCAFSKTVQQLLSWESNTHRIEAEVAEMRAEVASSTVTIPQSALAVFGGYEQVRAAEVFSETAVSSSGRPTRELKARGVYKIREREIRGFWSIRDERSGVTSSKVAQQKLSEFFAKRENQRGVGGTNLFCWFADGGMMRRSVMHSTTFRYQDKINRLKELRCKVGASLIVEAALVYFPGQPKKAARRDALVECARLDVEIARLRAAAKKEKQMARQIALNQELKRAETARATALARL